jgi:hypothetical protein
MRSMKNALGAMAALSVVAGAARLSMSDMLETMSIMSDIVGPMPGIPGSRRGVNRSKYTPHLCKNERPQQRYARQQAKIAARKAGA